MTKLLLFLSLCSNFVVIVTESRSSPCKGHEGAPNKAIYVSLAGQVMCLMCHLE